MATKTIDVCDVFDCASKNLEQYQVFVRKYDKESAAWTVLHEYPETLLCHRARERLLKKIRDGLSPPPKRSSQEESQTEETSEDEQDSNKTKDV